MIARAIDDAEARGRVVRGGVITRKTVNQMMSAIERRVCVRKLWRCNAGWGMLVIYDPVPEEYRGREKEYAMNGSVTAYYDTLEACVRAEYRVHVDGLSRPTRQSKTIR